MAESAGVYIDDSSEISPKEEKSFFPPLDSSFLLACF
jgi:hypothetical protein